MVSTVQFAEMQGNGDKACNSFNAFSWGGSESTHNPEGSSSLHFLKFSDVFYNGGAFEEPQLKSI